MLDPALTRNVVKRLRPNSEQVRAVLSGQLAVSGSKFIAGRVREDDDARRVLAVVINAEFGREEAGVFVFGTGGSGEFRTITTIPVTGDFHVSISQNDRDGTSNSADYLPSATVQSIDVTLSIEGGRERVSVVVTNAQALQDFIASARGLKELFTATEQLTPSEISHQWLRWYNPSILSSKASLNPTNYHQYLREPHHPSTLSKAIHGSPGDEAADLKVLEEAYIRQQMRLRIKEYSTSHPLLLHTATFNVNGKAPSERLYPLLGMPQGKTNEDEPWPDIFVFGFQELDLSTEALLYLSTTEKEEAWFDAIMEDMGDVSNDYIKLVSKQLVGMLMIVIVKKSLRPHIHHIHSTSSGQGYMWLGNKGGVAVRFRIYDTVFTFLNSHLAASRAAPGPVDDMIDRRNADFTELRRVLKFPEPAAVPAGDAEYTASGVQHSGILESDYTFWVGDQNYRIDLSDGDVRELIADAAQTRDYSPMFPFDQLKIQRDLGKCFTEFSEGRIDFIPTYRFELGPTLGLVHDVKRRPAWTDRILYRAAESVSLKQLTYDGHLNIFLSDHKPVTSRFELEALTFNLERMVSTLEEIRTPLEGPAEPEATPSLAIEPTHVDFGQVLCNAPLTKSVKLTSSSPAVVAFRFIPPSEGESIAPQWLTVTPESGIILPGKSLDVELTLNVNYNTTGALNKGANLRDMLVVHVENGRDYFVSITGDFQKTCLGNDLSWLASISDPIRGIDPSIIDGNHGPSAPKEVMRLISWLMSNATTEERLFLKPGVKAEVDTIIECLDTDAEFPSSQSPTFTLSVGDALLELLKSLREPVIPWRHQASCATVTSRDEAFEVIERFPPASTNVLVSVTQFLYFSLQEPNPVRARSLVIRSRRCQEFHYQAILMEESATKKLKTSKMIGTHNGTFHCDEALAVFLLRQTATYRDADLTRTRDPKLLDTCDIVVDVGAVYDAEKLRFDHHQREFDGVFGHGYTTKLSSAGLIYKHYGREIISNHLSLSPEDPKVETLWLKLYKEYIEAIDGVDNGVQQYPPEIQAKYRSRTDVSARVGWLNAAWNESVDSKSVDARFEKASKLVGEEFLSRLEYYGNAWLPARELVLNGLNGRSAVNPSGHIILFEQFCPWKEHLFDLEKELSVPDDQKPIYIVYPDETAGNWRIQAVPISPDSFISRKPLPEPWRGVRDDALSQVSGIPGGIFVHASGFIGGNQTQAGALEMARQALTM